MKILLTGTGGADGVPGLFSTDRVSTYARENGGKDVRGRSAAVIDGQIRLDFGPDVHAQCQRFNLNPCDWCAIVMTHSDADHFAIEELQYAVYPFTSDEMLPFTFYGNERIIRMVKERYPDWPFELFQTQAFRSFPHGEYTITPVEANHGHPDEEAHNLIIERGGKSMLYATDTGIWPEVTWDYLSRHRLDLLVIECSEGRIPTPYNGHLDIRECQAVVKRLRNLRVLGPDTPVVTTHHAHNGDMTHAELEAAMHPHGITVGYDGLVIEI